MISRNDAGIFISRNDKGLKVLGLRWQIVYAWRGTKRRVVTVFPATSRQLRHYQSRT